MTDVPASPAPATKFGGLTADVSKPFRVFLIDPVTEARISDAAGNPAWIDVWSADSEQARAYAKAQRKELYVRVKSSRNGQVEPDDALEANMATCAALTVGWYLVDPATKAQISVPFSTENAADLYSSPGAGWLFMQVWGEAHRAANFMQPRPKTSRDMPNGASGSTASSTAAAASATTPLPPNAP